MDVWVFVRDLYLCFFGFFMDDDFVGVFYVFVFVWFWFVECMDFGGDFIDDLFVSVLDQDFGLGWGGDGDVFWCYEYDWV